jgi:hypothetical protein
VETELNIKLKNPKGNIYATFYDVEESDVYLINYLITSQKFEVVEE